MMKYLCLVIGLLVGGAEVNAQGDSLSLQWWRSKGLLTSFPQDFGNLIHYLDSLSVEADGFKAAFDSARQKLPDARKNLKERINTYSALITRHIDSIKNASFFTKEKVTSSGFKSSFLFFYTNKELNDYLQSLNGLQVEMGLLFLGRDESNLNVFGNASCLNAYYSMTQSRSLLLAALDNLQRYYFLGSKADLIVDSVHGVQTSQFELSKSVGNVGASVGDVKQIAGKSDSLLSSSFVPNFKLGKTQSEKMKSGGTDRISTAANAIIIHDRKNWWWRTLIGGAVGGLIAGLIVHSAK